MPRRKRIKDYGNIITTDFEKEFINNWSNNEVTKEDIKSVSLILKAEGGSLVQILIAEDALYNGIFHLKEFSISEKDGVTSISIEDLEDIHDAKKYTYDSFMSKIDELAEKYAIEIPTDIEWPSDPLSNQLDYPKLLTE